MRLLFFISILPVVLLLLLVYKKDTKKEPKNLLTKAFVFGLLSAVPIVIIELLVGLIMPKTITSHIFIFINTFLGVGIIEEGFKWLVTKSIYKNNEFDETYDGIVYAVYASLGFAAIENVLFVLTGGMGIGLLRALTAVPGHAFYAIIMGYYMGLAKMFRLKNDTSHEKKLLFIALLLPTLLHTIYDYLLIDYSVIFFIIWLVFIIINSIYCIMLIFKASKNNYDYHIKNKYCIKCGNNVQDKNFCDICGTKNE